MARAAIATTLTAFGWLLLWEAVLAPLNPGGSWLVLKALPLGVLLPALMRGSRRARQWTTLLLPWYAAEALTRAWSESGRHAYVAGVAAALLLLACALQLAWFRADQRAQS